MAFNLTIDTDNDAFAPDSYGGDALGSELARILRDVALRLDGWIGRDGGPEPVRDVNGNTVGHWTLED